MTEQLNQLLADSMTLGDLYKRSHWQVAGPTFYQLHLLFDKHFGEQVDLVDAIAEEQHAPADRTRAISEQYD
jgi:starvation-inducible DNA-binding protein